jgi:hypothetical protein
MDTAGGETVTVAGDFLPLTQTVIANYSAGGAATVYSVGCVVAVPSSGVSQAGMSMACGPTLPGVGANLYWSFYAGAAATAIPVSGTVSPVSSCEWGGICYSSASSWCLCDEHCAVSFHAF